jgi:hypothetical protein
VLLQVTRRAGRDDWQRFANNLLNHCLTWPPDQAGVADAALCHGPTGVAHIFNRIYHSDNDPKCMNAALMWFERALALRQPGSGVGGLFIDETQPFRTNCLGSEPCFLGRCRRSGVGAPS